MAAILVKLSLLIDRCIELSNPLRINRDQCDFFKKIFVIPGGCAPNKFQRVDTSTPFQIEMGGTN